MWAYESVFYQIYPLGFCGAPFENDGVLTHRILKVNDWIEHIKNRMQYIFHLYLNRTHTVTILVTTKKSTAVLAQMTTLKKYAKIYTKTTSKLFLTAYSTTSDEDFGHFRTFSKTGRTHVTAIGFSLISTVIQITMTVFGTKAGRVISTL